MKITGVKAVYPNYQHVVPSWRPHFWQIVVRVETDPEVTGFGYGGGGAAAVKTYTLCFNGFCSSFGALTNIFYIIGAPPK